MRGLVVFSFALSNEEPNPCNRRLGYAVERILRNEGEEVKVVAQWEVARQLERDGVPVVLVVERPQEGYLDSQMVWDQAKRYFQHYGITEVIPVANTFLHLNSVNKMIAADGFTVVDRRELIGTIGFYRDSAQWWTRGPLRLLLYGIRVKIFGKHG